MKKDTLGEEAAYILPNFSWRFHDSFQGINSAYNSVQSKNSSFGFAF